MEKELYFVRYLILKFRDFCIIFSRIFSNFFRDFSDFENIYKKQHSIFEIKISKNTLPKIPVH